VGSGDVWPACQATDRRTSRIPSDAATAACCEPSMPLPAANSDELAGATPAVRCAAFPLRSAPGTWTSGSAENAARLPA
jgi:hypothetical protein